MLRWGSWPLAALLLAATVTARAEPDAVAKYLMDQPVSMLDFGVYRLNETMRRVMEAEHGAIGSARYDWGGNRIVLVGFATAGGATTTTAAKLECREMLTSIRYIMGVSGDTGESIFGENSLVNQYFLHKGYRDTGQPKDLAEKLAGMVVLEATVTADTGEQVSCRGPLRGSLVQFRDPEQ